jgi:hypothetical protein
MEQCSEAHGSNHDYRLSCARSFAIYVADEKE